MRGLGEETVGAWLAASVSVPQRCFELVPKSPAGSGGLSAAATFAAAKVHRTSTRGPPATCGPPDGKSGTEAADVTALLQAHEAPLRGPSTLGHGPVSTSYPLVAAPRGAGACLTLGRLGV